MDIREHFGMFDTIRSSFDLGSEFTDIELETKDFSWIGGTLSFYWIDPNGYLWKLDEKESTEPQLFERMVGGKKLSFLHWNPTGKRPRLKRYYFTDQIRVYPRNYPGQFKNIPEMRLFFSAGELKNFEVVNKKKSSVSND